jgi:GT2 family glycosyltransferase
MEYSVIIRTLGKAGEAYQTTLNSVIQQTIRPVDIFVYIAEGYNLPKETIGVEKYVCVPKGMVAQRALKYDEVKAEYCLFLDDDVFLPPDAVAKMYDELIQNEAQVISPCTFENHKTSFKSKVIKMLTGKEVFRIHDDRWAFKVLRTAGFSYNNNPTKHVYESQSNAGPCFFCRKSDFLKIKYDEELWLDKTYYALPDDQIMFYKMYKKGLKILTSFDSGVVHLDASTTIANPKEKSLKLIFSEYRNKLIFWHRFIYLPEKPIVMKLWSLLVVLYTFGLQALKYVVLFVLRRKDESWAFYSGVRSGIEYLRSEEYKLLPRI